MKNLVESIKSHAQEYYEGNPSISDLEFDNLVDQLRVDDPDHIILRTVGWGYTPSTKSSMQHVTTMGSLDKVKYEDGEFECDNTIISHKLDGASATAYYHNGKIDRVISRGDGNVGIDITKMLVLSGSIPLTVDSMIKSVRGEVVMTDSSFKELGNYTSHRNAATGISQSMSFDMAKHIEFIAYHIIEVEAPIQFFYYSTILMTLKDEGFGVVNWHTLNNNHGYESLHDTYSTKADVLIQARQGTADKYLVDGAVICEQKVEMDGTLIRYDAFAVKYENQEVDVKVTHIEWNESDSGRLIPVICYETVFLSGAELSRCSGHNALAIRDAKIGAGSIIRIKRSNEVIPYWVDTIEANGADIPRSWGGKVFEWAGVHLRAEVHVEAKMVEAIIFANTPDGIGNSTCQKVIDGLSILTLDKLQYFCLVKDTKEPRLFKDLLGTTKMYELFMDTLDNILNRPRDMSSVLQYSFIDNMGGSGALAVAKQISRGDLIDNLKFNHKFPTDVEEALPSYVPGEDVKSKWADVVKLLEFPFNWKEYKEPAKDTSKYKVTMTGKMSDTRNNLLNKWKEHGVVEVDVASCDYLVYAGSTSSSKFKKAFNLGKKIVTEEGFENILKGA